MMIRTELFPVSTPRGLIPAVAHLPRSTPAPVVVCCHGLLSYKDSPKFVSIGERFAREGIAVVRFDFTGCGENQASHDRTLISTRLSDLAAVLAAVSEASWADGRIGLLGSSFGGYISLLIADSGRRYIDAVACWATPFDLERIRVSLEETNEFTEVRFPPGLKMGSPLNLSGLRSAARIMIIHGQQDETVPWNDAVEIYRTVREPKRLLLMRTADHRFMDPVCRETAVDVSLEWFREQGVVGNG